MMRPRSVAVALSLFFCVLAGAKDKKKAVLPTEVLQARTILVIVDPDAGMSPEAPLENRNARDEVEKSLLKWGRFRPAVDASDADLIVSIRKGSKTMARPTVGGIPNNNRPVIFGPPQTGPDISSGPEAAPNGYPSQGPHPQMEGGAPEDLFFVYRGQRGNPLSYPPVWRYAG